MLALALKGKAQKADTAYQKKIIPKTSIEVLFSYYNQDGDHSAVTGGIGTEKLNVYAPMISIAYTRNKSELSFNAGGDIVSSASTDNIDFVKSSPSKVDTRMHTDVDYSRQLTKSGFTLSGGTGFSLESDYLSLPMRLKVSYAPPSGMRSMYAAFYAYFDDLRWGRLNPDYRRPVTLVYPYELRYKQWFDIYKRNSYNLKAGFDQVINKRLITGIFPEVVYQKGLLSTPFHRVFFTDDSVKVENLPQERFKFPVGFRVNWFVGSRTILKAFYEYYYDTFGINAGSFEAEAAVKITPVFTIKPFVRYYRQSSARYFKPYKEHDISENYYTSDYDLSRFHSIKAGIGIRFAPNRYLLKKSMFSEMSLRYAYYGRSDKLAAHMLTFSCRIEIEGNPKKPKND